MTLKDRQDFVLFGSGTFLGMRFLNQWTVGRRIGITIAIVWLPLLVLSALQGMAMGPTSAKSFLLDVAVYAKYMIAVPLLLASPIVCRAAFVRVVHYFIKSGIIKEQDKERFNRHIVRTIEKRDSVIVQVIILIGIYLTGWMALPELKVQFTDTWRMVVIDGKNQVSWAGWWAMFISQPFYMYVLLRFLYRVILWWGFLWRISRFDLQCNPAHPDAAGGMGFMGLIMPVVAIPVFAISSSIAGSMADLVLWKGVSVLEHKYVIASFIVLSGMLFVCPMAFFIRKLREVQEEGILRYGILAAHQLNVLDKRWVDHDENKRSDIYVSPDFSSASDMNTLISSIHRMRLFPLRPEEITPVLVAATLPFVPVIALQVPWNEILEKVIRFAV